MKKAKSNQRARHSLRQVEPTGARSVLQRGKATHPPRSGRGATPKAEPSIAAAGLAEIVPPVGQGAPEGHVVFSAENAAGQGQTGMGPGPNGRGVEGLLAERERTHGVFGQCATVTALIRDALRHSYTYDGLSPRHRLALEEISLKMARIVCGDPFHPDHWADIEGYARKGAGR